MTLTLALYAAASWLLLGQAEPRACRVARLPTEPAKVQAIRCAEEFIARNGYTSKAPTVDSASMAHESIVFAASPAEELRARRNSLEDHAIGVCASAPRDSSGFTVVFRSKGHLGAARAVTMNAHFQELRVEHQDFRLEVVKNHQYGCEPVPDR
jgi:hypothetical protein